MRVTYFFHEEDGDRSSVPNFGSSLISGRERLGAVAMSAEVSDLLARAIQKAGVNDATA